MHARDRDDRRAGPPAVDGADDEHAAGHLIDLPNFRDLGGVALADGAETRPGRIFRSGRPDQVDAAGWRRLIGRGIGTIIDLRNAYEIAPLPERPEQLRVVHRPIEDQSDDEFMATWSEHLGSPRYYLTVLRRWPHLVADALSAIADADPGSAVLIHCSAGRDRTGMIAALLLTAAGASLDAVQSDYERGMRGIRRDLPTGTPHDRQLSDEDFEAAVIEQRNDLAVFLAHADVDGMLEAAGAPGDTLDRAAARLL
ncbi:MAG: tyrosine-protein phosphatase [Leifsonia sp.]